MVLFSCNNLVYTNKSLLIINKLFIAIFPSKFDTNYYLYIYSRYDWHQTVLYTRLLYGTIVA